MQMRDDLSKKYMNFKFFAKSAKSGISKHFRINYKFFSLDKNLLLEAGSKMVTGTQTQTM
jgi:hypothetical protein